MSTRSAFAPWLALSAVLAIGCHDGSLGAADGDDDSTDPGGGDNPGGDDGTPVTIPFSCPGGTLAAGLNTLPVNGVTRTVFADFPTSTALPIGVVFSWHGFGQLAENFRAEVGLDPNANPDRPLVIITPNDTGLLPPAGLAWNIVDGANNVDLQLFEAVLGCLDDQYTIDATSIYSFGFSAGAVMANLVHASYPDLVPTIVTESGAWFDDPAEAMMVHSPIPMQWSWPALDPANGGTVLLTHGGPNDVTVANILDLEASATAAVPFLHAAARDVVDCAHEGGHALDPDVPPRLILEFLSSHRTGDTQGLADDVALPASCTPHAAN